PELETEPALESVPESELETEPALESMPEPELEPESALESVPELETVLEPEPEPKPEPEPEPEPEPLPRPQPSFEPLMWLNVLARSQDAVREARIDNVEVVLMEDQSVKVSVQGPMFFELGKATLQSEVLEFLDRLALVIEQTPFAVQVIGHTDDVPMRNTELFPSNWELSAARAARVARYLIDSAGLDPRRFTVIGRGEMEPAVPNTSDANRALNRRVEIIITRDEVEPKETAQ
ncbi:MAG: OmpA family protein, partial [Halochromatium sp.]|uniref:OmpA family protein n=1 Tax=Halochromatium sp. TaxID=2049430 RepID=UPI003978D2B8